MNVFNIIKTEIGYLFKKKGLGAFVLALALLPPILGFMPSIAYFHLVILAILFIRNMNDIKINAPLALVFLLYVPISLWISEPDPLFRSWERLAMFAVVFIMLSPMVLSKKYAEFRKRLLICFLIILTIASVISFICYFLGINYMTTSHFGMIGMDMYMSSGGIFAGLFNQSIVLGWAAGLSLLYALYRSTLDIENKNLYRLICAILFVTILFSASRSSLIATGAAVVLFLYKSNEKRGRFFQSIIGLFLIATLSFPIWEGALSGVQSKYERDDGYNSREDKWTCRINEFKSSPFVGIGFASVDPNGKDGYNPITGQIEPGNSWLAILAQTGLIGFLLIFFIVRKPVMYLWKRPTLYNSFLLALCIFFGFHFMAEGYGLAGGNVLCFVAWLVLGCASDALIIDEVRLPQTT